MNCLHDISILCRYRIGPKNFLKMASPQEHFKFEKWYGLNCVTPNLYVEILIPSSSEVTLFKNMIVAGVIS